MPANKPPLKHLANRYGLIGLFWLALLTGGAKTPFAFFIWATAALCLSAFSLTMDSARYPMRHYWKALLLCLFIALSQWLSADASTSLFWTAQAFVFLLVWIAIDANPALITDHQRLYFHLSIMGILTLGLTLFQYTRDWNHTYGFFPFNPNYNAVWMGALGVLFLAYALELKRSKSFYFYLTLGCLLLLALAAGPARGAVLGAGVSVCFVLRRFFTLRYAIVLLGLLALVLLVIPNPTLARRVRSNEGNYRLQIWAIARRAVQDRPWTGTGLGNFEIPYQRYAFPVETDSIRYARTTMFTHNEFIQVATDVGIPAFLLIVWAVLFVFGAPVLKGSDRRKPAKAGFLVLAVVAFMNITWHLPVLLYLTLICGALLKTQNTHLRPQAAHRLTPWLFLAIAVWTEGALGWSAVRQDWAEHGEWEKVTSVAPNDGWAWRYRATQQKDLRAVLDCLQRAATLVPEQVYIHEAFAEALEASQAQTLLPAALREYRAAIQLAPSRAINYVAVGRVLMGQGHPQEALEWFQKARRIEPHYWESDLWIARSLKAAGELRRSRWVLRNLQQRHERQVTLRAQIVQDIASGDTATLYSDRILAYDSAIVAHELNHL